MSRRNYHPTGTPETPRPEPSPRVTLDVADTREAVQLARTVLVCAARAVIRELDHAQDPAAIIPALRRLQAALAVHDAAMLADVDEMLRPKVTP